MLETLINLIKRCKARNNFNPSFKDIVEHQDLAKIIEGKVSNSKQEDSVYFVVCKNKIGQLNRKGKIEVSELNNVVDEVFNKSEWFGKFAVSGQSQIIVPFRYDLLINSQKKQVYLESNLKARYYNNGNLQLDKDLYTGILKTKISFEEMRDIINQTCLKYLYGYSLKAWN